MLKNVPVMNFECKGWVGCLGVSGLLFAGMVRGAVPGVPLQDPPLAIPVLRQELKLDGILSDGEWDDAAVITGAIDQFEGTASARAVTFRIKRGEDALYIAQRSALKPRSPHPLWFKDGDDNSVVVAIAPGVVNHGDEESHYVLRFNPEGHRIGWEVTGQYRGVKLRWPHLPWQNHNVVTEPGLAYGYGFRDIEQSGDGSDTAPAAVLIASHVDHVRGVWTSEMRIPLAALNVEAFPADQTWGLLLARDYPGVEQTAIVRSDDWRHGTANRVRGVGFYNLYRDATSYLPVRFRDGTEPVRRQITDTPADDVTPDDVASAYFSGYHRLDTHGQTSSEDSFSVYNPMRNEIFVRTRLGSVNRGMEAERLAVSIRRQGERVPLVTHAVTNDAIAWVGLQMNNGPHVGPLGMVLEWVAPVDGVADVDYRMANIREPLAEPGPDASALQRAHYLASIDGGHATLVQVPADGGESVVHVERRAFSAYREWVPIGAEGIAVAAGDRLQLYVGVRGVSFKDNIMSGSIHFEDQHGNRRRYSPVDEFDARQGGRSGVWFYRYDRDTTPNPDGAYEPMVFDPARARWQVMLDAFPNAPLPSAIIAKTRMEDERIVRFALPELDPGIYEARLDVFDRDRVLLGRNRELFVRYDHARDLPWLGAGVGVSDAVLPGWHALETTAQADALQFAVTGRVVRVTGDGFLEQISVGGTDLLAAPMRLDILRDGTRVALRPRLAAPQAVVTQADHAVFEAGLQGDGWQVALVLNLVARPFTFTGPRRIGFGLQATPVKALPDDFRGRMNRLSLNVAFTGSDPAGNGWDWNGQMVSQPDGKRKLVSGHGSNPYPLNWALSRRRGASNPQSPFAPEGLAVPARDPGPEGYVRGLRGAGYLPYQALNAILQPAELDHPLVAGIHGANFYGYLGSAVASDREWGDANIAVPDADYRLWHYRHWIRNSYLDGLYFDNTFPTLDGLSSGYDLDLPDRPDLHGKRQPGYALRNQREFFKRLRTVFHEEGVDPVIWLHVTDAFVIPAFAFTDVLMDGEHFPGLTPERPWSSAKWPIYPPHMRTLTGSQKWGMAVYYLPMIRTFSTQDDDLRTRVYRNLNGYYALFDCLTEVRWPVFGLDLDAAAEFYPYWGDTIAQGTICQEEGIAISAWTQGGRLYLLAFNFSEQTHAPARLLIRPDVFGLTGTRWSVRDLEPDDGSLNQTLWDRKRIDDYNEKYRGASLDFEVRDAGVGVVVPILPRNYRVMVVEPAGE